MAMEKAERTVPLLPMKYSNTATQIAMANIAAVRTVMKAVQVLRQTEDPQSQSDHHVIHAVALAECE
jgi:hypothetical protein